MIYKGNGSFYYPKIQSNILRKKGTEYFEAVELIGSNERTEKSPKMSLLQQYRDVIVPDLERKVVQRLSDDGQKKLALYFRRTVRDYTPTKLTLLRRANCLPSAIG